MARQTVTNITSMPQSVEDERRARMWRYAIMMGIRVACFLAMIWVRGPWIFVFAAGAIFLPYFAVVIANSVRVRRASIERPGAIEVLYPPAEWFPGTTEAGAADDTPPRSSDRRGA